MEPAKSERPQEELPRSQVRRNWKTWLFWLVPFAAAALVAYFVYEDLAKGPTITVYFNDAGNLEAEKSQVKLRGVQIGTVDAIELTRDNGQAKLKVSLNESGENVAREGSQFWIVQPHVGFSEIKGLGTVVSGDYVAVQPGSGKRKTTFRGLSEPPAPRKEEQGINIVLIAEKQGSVKKHSPVMYKGIQVGEVWDTRLGPESQVVNIMVKIEKRYAPLVRMNSVFWNAGGINFNLGLSGLDVSAQSAQALLFGGIDLATPDTREPQAYPNTAYRLYDKPQNAWLSWSPAIKLPAAGEPEPADTKSGEIP